MAVQDKLGSLLGRPSGYIKSLAPAVRQRVDGLQGVQVDIFKLTADYQREVFELEKKYAKLYKPHYELRRKIVNGELEPTKDLVERGQAEDLPDSDAESGDEEEEEEKRPYIPESETSASEEKGIPQFWLTALQSHVGIAELISDRDVEILQHLSDISVEYLDDKPGFKLIFKFTSETEEFFKNADQVLVKTYYYQDEASYQGDQLYDHAEGTTIDWVEGKDTTVIVEHKKQKNRKTNQSRIVTTTKPAESFFSFFSPPHAHVDEDEKDVDQEELEERLELDYQTGEEIKELVHRAIDYFTGKALQFGADDEDEDELDDFEDDEEDEDEDESIVSEQRLSGPPTGATPASQNGPNECKQS